MSSAFFKVTEHTIHAQHIRQYPNATLHSPDELLRLAVKQYTPLNNANPQKGDVTIIAAHANGFPKVCLELLALLLTMAAVAIQLTRAAYRSCTSRYGTSCFDGAHLAFGYATYGSQTSLIKASVGC
jgi:hypothetical protein